MKTPRGPKQTKPQRLSTRWSLALGAAILFGATAAQFNQATLEVTSDGKGLAPDSRDSTIGPNGGGQPEGPPKQEYSGCGTPLPPSQVQLDIAPPPPVVANAEALAKQELIKNADDTRAVAAALQDLSLKEVPVYLGRAKDSLNTTLGALERAEQVAGLPEMEQKRFRNVIQNARDKTDAALQVFEEEKLAADNFAQQSPLKSLFQQTPLMNPFAKTESLAEIFSQTFDPKKKDDPGASTNDGLVDRTAMLHSLPKEEREKLQQSLNNIEIPKAKLPDGKTVDIPLVHNGYFFGGGETGTDCSKFVTEALPPELRKLRYTTLDFRMIWELSYNGAMPRPPIYELEREKTLRQIARSFQGLHLARGDTLRSGDLLVFRPLALNAGHVFLVKESYPKRGEVLVLEASQSAGTLRQRVFKLRMPDGLIKPGFFGLRLKGQETAQCRLPEPNSKGIGARMPASTPIPQSPTMPKELQMFDLRGGGR